MGPFVESTYGYDVKNYSQSDVILTAWVHGVWLDGRNLYSST